MITLLMTKLLGGWDARCGGSLPVPQWYLLLLLHWLRVGGSWSLWCCRAGGNEEQRLQWPRSWTWQELYRYPDFKGLPFSTGANHWAVQVGETCLFSAYHMSQTRTYIFFKSLNPKTFAQEPLLDVASIIDVWLFHCCFSPWSFF